MGRAAAPKLVACVELAKADELLRKQRDWLMVHPFTEGPFCWIVKDPQAFPEPIPYRGQQSLFHVPTETLQLPPLERATTSAQPCLF